LAKTRNFFERLIHDNHYSTKGNARSAVKRSSLKEKEKSYLLMVIGDHYHTDPKEKKIERNLTEETKKFWSSAEKTSEKMKTWPASRRAGINVETDKTLEKKEQDLVQLVLDIGLARSYDIMHKIQATTRQLVFQNIGPVTASIILGKK
jgi:hypothetical protein